jgi:hypothetical protein
MKLKLTFLKVLVLILLLSTAVGIYFIKIKPALIYSKCEKQWNKEANDIRKELKPLMDENDTASVENSIENARLYHINECVKKSTN